MALLYRTLLAPLALVCIVATLVVVLVLPQIGSVTPASQVLPLVPNRGQAAAAVAYQAQGAQGALFFTPAEVVLSTRAPGSDGGVLRLQFAGADRPTLVPDTELPTRTNYLHGDDPAHWLRDIPSYGGLTYRALYPGIDAHYTGTDGRLKSTYTVAPYADPALIQLRYHGAAELQLAAGGGLTMLLGGQRLSESAPVAWQDLPGGRVSVVVRFAVGEDGLVRFTLGSYNRALPLVIDPLLGYGTFIGGAGDDRVNDLVVDATGNAYAVGTTFSADFPTQGALDATLGGSTDVFVTKLAPDGATALYSTYLGGSATDQGLGIALVGSDAVVVGQTLSANFPTVSATQATAAGGGDAFVARLNASGNSLVFGSYLGGNGADSALAVAARGDDLYLTGTTISANPTPFPTVNAVQTARQGGDDAFFALYDENAGSYTLSHSTYLGGGGNDIGRTIAVASDGTVYVGGGTSSDTVNAPNFPVSGGVIQPTKSNVGRDGFVSRIVIGAPLTWTNTFVGGALADDEIYGLDIGSGGVYLTGYTRASDFPLAAAAASGPLRTSIGGAQDGFVARISTDLTTRSYASFLGGSGDDQGNAITVAAGGTYAVAGWTSSADFTSAALGSLQSYGGARDAFGANLATNDGLLFATYLGGAGNDEAQAVRVRNAGIYLAGFTGSAAFPTSAGAYDTTYGGSNDGFVILLGNAPPALDLDGAGPANASTAYSASFTEDGGAVAVVDAAALTATDADSPQLASATATLTSTPDGVAESLSATASGGVTVTYSAGVLTLTGPASVADFQTTLRSVRYINSSQNPTTSARTITFVVSDGVASSPPVATTLSVVAVDDLPTIASQSFSIAENSANSTVVGTVIASDPDSTLAYSITAGNTGGAFAIDPASGQITVASSSALDRETTPTYTLTVRATGGSNSSSTTVTITLTDVNEPPTIAAQTLSIAENSANGTVVGQLAASDPEGAALIYSVVAADAAFAVSASGQVTVADASLLNFEAATSRNFTVKVNDGTSDSAVVTITITITNVNEVPTISAASFSLAENSANATVVGSVSASDPENATLTYSITAGNTGGAFAIASNGQITVATASALDFETTPGFTLTIQASDGTNSASATITITLTNVDEAPVFAAAPYSFNLAENSANGTTVGSVSATDPEAATVNYSITAGNGSGAFTINSTTGALTVANATPLDRETTPTFTLTVQASDGSNTSTATVTITLTNVNEAPVVSDQSFNVVEASAGGTIVGTIVFSDDGPAPTFSVTGGSGQSAFAVDAGTGIIRVSDALALDVEVATSFTLDVTVSDGTLSDTATITITVTLVNDAPVVTTTVGTASFTEDGTAVAIDTGVTVTDADSADFAGGSLTVTIASGDAGDTLTLVDGAGVTVVAGTVSVGGNPVGTVSGGTAGSALVVSFSGANATTAAAQAIARQIQYASTSQAFAGGATTTKNVTFAVNDGDAAPNTGSASRSISVLGSNDAPVLDASGALRVATIGENIADADNTGTSVAQILASAGGDRVTDVDSGALEGIAVVAASTTNGSWQFSTNAGTSWSAFGALSSGAATLLAADARVRFVPNVDFNGEIVAGLTFHAWDQSSGTNGQVGVDVTVTGGTTAYSAASDTADLTVSGENSAPVLDASGAQAFDPIDEDTPAAANPGTLVRAMLARGAGGAPISDPDTGALQGIAVIGISGTISGTWQYAIDGVTWQPLGVVSDSSAVLLASDATTRVRFVPAANVNGSVALSFRAWDQTLGMNGMSGANATYSGARSATSSASGLATLLVNPVNDAPLATSDRYRTRLNTALSIAAPGVLRNDSDIDNQPLTAVLVAGPANGTLTLASDGSFVYTPTGGFAGSDSFSYRASDGSAQTEPVVVMIDVGGRRYLPLTYGSPARPDLVATLALSPDTSVFSDETRVQLSVTVRNQGTAATAAGFWVDLYLSPNQAPATNLRWDAACGLRPCYGIAWYVDRALAPGEQIVLTSDASSFRAQNTRWRGNFAAGTTDIYVLVDSWNPGVATGAIDEISEANNLVRRSGITVSGARQSQTTTLDAEMLAPREP